MQRDAKFFNRLVAVGAMAVLALLGVVLALLNTPARKDFFNRPSTYFTDESGARALFLVMQEFVSEAVQWKRSLHLLPAPGNESLSTLIVAAPYLALSKAEADRLKQWVGDGGQLILITKDGWRIGSDAAMSTASEERGEYFLDAYGIELEKEKDRKPELRRVLTRSQEIEELDLYIALAGGEADDRSFAVADSRTAAMEIEHGRGRIIVIPDEGFAGNRALKRGDNAVWLVQLCRHWIGTGVLFDEYHHGFGESMGIAELTGLFVRTPWGCMVLQLMAAGGLYAVLYRKRMGKVEKPVEESLRSPMRLLEARAGFLRSAHAQNLCADLIAHQLSVQLQDRPVSFKDWQRFFLRQKEMHTGAMAQRFERLGVLYEELKTRQAAAGEHRFVEFSRLAGEVQRKLVFSGDSDPRTSNGETLKKGS